MQRITLVIASLASGGAERVMTSLAHQWVEAGRQVTLVTLYGESADFYMPDERVQRVSLELGFATTGAAAAVLSNLRRIWHLRQTVIASAPDVVVSFMTETNLLTILALRGTGVAVVVSERTDPAQQVLGRSWSALRRILYRMADAVVVQSPEVRDWVERFVPASRIHILPNPVAEPVAEPLASTAAGEFGLSPHGTTILAMGRLAEVKGFDILIRAFAHIAERHPEWSLVIFGEGEDRDGLEALAAELGVAGKVRLPGRVADPEAYLAVGGVFALPSRYEGFPNALLEAMACGLPVVAADCPSGPRQIIRHGVDGLLIPPEDPIALAEALNELLSAPQLRERLARAAPEVVNRFSINRVMGAWDAVFAEATAGSDAGRDAGGR